MFEFHRISHSPRTISLFRMNTNNGNEPTHSIFDQTQVTDMIRIDDDQDHLRRRAPTRHSKKAISNRKIFSKQTSIPAEVNVWLSRYSSQKSVFEFFPECVCKSCHLITISFTSVYDRVKSSSNYSMKFCCRSVILFFSRRICQAYQP